MSRFGQVLITAAMIFSTMALPNAFGDDLCPKKSTAFAFCVQYSLTDHAYESKDRAELEKFIRQDCAKEMKEHNDCDGIDKTSYVDEFIKSRVEFFKKDRPKAVARSLKDTTVPQDSSIN